MSRYLELSRQLSVAAAGLGLPDVVPVLLNAGGNSIFQLAPYPVVARLATFLSAEDTGLAHQRAARELQVARHLMNRGVAVLSPTELAAAGPHEVNGIWMTLWEYVPRTDLAPPAPSEALALVTALSSDLADCPGELPPLGVWEQTRLSAARLQDHPDRHVQTLLREFVIVNQQLRQRQPLLPCHGDAHPKNLLASPRGWLWTDFEDACLMPAGWDLASFVANPALFQGFEHPTVCHFLQQAATTLDPGAFQLALTARVLMSILGNLDLALAGHGDLEFATRQLNLAESFLQHAADLANRSNVTASSSNTQTLLE